MISMCEKERDGYKRDQAINYWSDRWIRITTLFFFNFFLPSKTIQQRFYLFDVLFCLHFSGYEMRRDDKNGECSQCFELLMRSGIRGSAHDTVDIASLWFILLGWCVCAWGLNIGVCMGLWLVDVWGAGSAGRKEELITGEENTPEDMIEQKTWMKDSRWKRVEEYRIAPRSFYFSPL